MDRDLSTPRRSQLGQCAAFKSAASFQMTEFLLLLSIMASKQTLLACVITGLCIGCLAVPPVPEIRWHSLPPLPENSGGHLLVSYQSQPLVIGGTNWVGGNKIWYNRILQLKGGENVWATVGELPYPTGYSTGTVVDRTVIVSGGNTTGNQNVAHTFLITSNWQCKVLPDTAAPPYGAASTAVGERLFSCGGLLKSNDWETASSRFAVLNTLDPEAGWQEQPPMPGTGRALAGICAWQGKLFVFGGADRKICNLADCWTFDIAGNHWKRLPDMPFPMRSALAFPWKEWIILIVNCMTTNEGTTITTDRILFFHPESSAWLNGGHTPYSAVADGMITDNKIFLVGGEDKALSRTAECAVGILE